MATAKKKPTWRITVLRKSLGTVKMADADEAIKVTIKTLEITGSRAPPPLGRPKDRLMTCSPVD